MSCKALRRTVKLMHDIAVTGIILLAMTVKLELTLNLELQVAGSFAKSQGVTIKSSKERKEGEAVNFSQQYLASEEVKTDERAKDQDNMVKYNHSMSCKALRRTVKLMHDIAVTGIILLAMTVKLELPHLIAAVDIAVYPWESIVKLIDRISKRGNLVKAWKSLTKRPFSYGFDKITIEQFREGLDGHLEEIQKQLHRSEYKFYPLRLYLAKKKDGGYRPIKIPTVRDRVVQKAVYDAIYSHLNDKYHIDNPASYAYIKERRIEYAAKRILQLRSEGYRYCCKADIVKFFERVDKKTLLKLVTDALPDDSINHIVEAAITNDIDITDHMYYERKTGKAYKYDQLAGIAQGSPLSPMFANLFLYGFDEYMTKQGIIMIRYADDMLFLCKSTDKAEQAYRLAHKYLEKIGLELYPLRDDIPGELWKKDGKYSHVRSLENLEFLGLRFSSGKVYPANSSYKNVMKEIRGVAYSRSISLVKKIQSINARVEGWTNAFSYTTEETKRLIALDASLEGVLNKMLIQHGLKKKIEQQKTTGIFGLPTFQQSSSEAHEARNAKTKTEEIK